MNGPRPVAVCSNLPTTLVVEAERMMSRPENVKVAELSAAVVAAVMVMSLAFGEFRATILDPATIPLPDTAMPTASDVTSFRATAGCFSVRVGTRTGS